MVSFSSAVIFVITLFCDFCLWYDILICYDFEIRGMILKFLSWCDCYDIKPVRKEEGKFYWKIPLCDDDATREK